MTAWTNEVQPFGKNHAPLLTGLSSSNDGTAVPVAVDPATGELLVSSSGGGGGTQYAEGATTAPGTGTLAIGRHQASPPLLADQELYGLQLDSQANLLVNLAEAEITLGTSSTFNSTFPSNGTAIGGLNGTNMVPFNIDGSGFLEVAVENSPSVTQLGPWTTALNDSANAAIGATVLDLTNANPLTVAVTDTSGNQISSFGGTQYAEGATTTPGTGTLALGRYSSPSPTLTAGTLEGLQLDSSGNLKVNVAVGGSSSSSSSTAVTSGDVSTIAGQPVNTVTPGTQLVSLTDELGDPFRSTVPGALDIAIVNVAVDSSENMKTAPGAFEVANPFNSTEQGCALSVKATQGYLLSILVTNYNAAKRYLHIISKPTAPASGDVPTFSFPIPAGNSIQPAYVSIGQEFFGSGGSYLQFGVAVGVSTTANVFNQASSADHTLAGLYV